MYVKKTTSVVCIPTSRLAAKVSVSRNFVKENKQEQTSFVYPNPISDEAKIKIANSYNPENKAVTVYDVNGEIVSASTYKPFEEITIHKNQFSSGIYFYKVTSNEIQITQGKFIIE